MPAGAAVFLPDRSPAIAVNPLFLHGRRRAYEKKLIKYQP
jgi:hypothetical protein